MKAGWKTRIDERRYFEEKRKAWLDHVNMVRSLEIRMKLDAQ